MTLNQLRVFLALADAGSARAAAERLVVTQPAVSGALRALQDELGVALVEPEGRGLRLTAAGTDFAQRVRQALGILDQARIAAADQARPEQGTVRVAAVTTASEHVLARSLALFHARHPGVEVRLDVGTRADVWARMERREADVALAGRPPSHLGLRTRAVAPNRLVMVAAPGVAPAAKDTRLGDLGGVTFLLREAGSGTRSTLLGLLDAGDVSPPTLTLGSNGAVIAGAEAGLGVTLLSRDAVVRHLDEGTLVEIPTEVTPLDRPWHAVTHTSSPPTADLFIADLLADDHTGRFRAPPDNNG